MSSETLNTPRHGPLRLPTGLGPLRINRAIIAAIFIALAVFPGELGALTRSLMTDAFVQVSVFVAATLMLFYGAERVFKFDIGTALQNARGFQVPLAALLGATPGCGGAVVVVAAYSSGHVGMGALVATLTATMGDAAFLLIATRPEVAAVVLPVSMAVGIASGWIVDLIHPRTTIPRGQTCEVVAPIGKLRLRDLVYLVVAAPGLIVGAAQLVQIEIPGFFGIPIEPIALAGVATGLFVWATSPVNAMTSSSDSPATRATEETSFITVWVLGAYLAYDYAAAYLGLDLAATFDSVAPLLPLIAIAIGFVPGCGPQVLVTTLYINGVIPFAALIGNAISNDGDALFPAIALNPRAAVIATVYSSIPALIVAYGFYFAAPSFMN